MVEEGGGAGLGGTAIDEPISGSEALSLLELPRWEIPHSMCASARLPGHSRCLRNESRN